MRDREYGILQDRSRTLGARLKRLQQCRGALADAGELTRESDLLALLFIVFRKLAELEADVEMAIQESRDEAEQRFVGLPADADEANHRFPLRGGGQ